MAEADGDAACVLAFPAYTTYTNLVARSRVALETLGIGVLLVAEDGEVAEPFGPTGGRIVTDEPGAMD